MLRSPFTIHPASVDATSPATSEDRGEGTENYYAIVARGTGPGAIVKEVL